MGGQASREYCVASVLQRELRCSEALRDRTSPIYQRTLSCRTPRRVSFGAAKGERGGGRRGAAEEDADDDTDETDVDEDATEPQIILLFVLIKTRASEG